MQAVHLWAGEGKFYSVVTGLLYQRIEEEDPVPGRSFYQEGLDPILFTPEGDGQAS